MQNNEEKTQENNATAAKLAFGGKRSSLLQGYELNHKLLQVFFTYSPKAIVSYAEKFKFWKEVLLSDKVTNEVEDRQELRELEIFFDHLAEVLKEVSNQDILDLLERNTDGMCIVKNIIAENGDIPNEKEVSHG